MPITPLPDQPPLFADAPAPSPVNVVLLRIAEHFERMAAREHANGNYARAEALRDAAIYAKLQLER